MHIRITTGRYDPSREDEVKTMVESDVLSAARQLPGFKSYTGGLDRQAGRLTAVTIWETGEQAQGFRDKLGVTSSSRSRTWAFNSTNPRYLKPSSRRKPT